MFQESEISQWGVSLYQTKTTVSEDDVCVYEGTHLLYSVFVL